ncbi:hypothetical protein [Bradyrhizobium sp.]|uniref:hypothetical protein n=1 Tax=Bradyrhizobium sp. TaxID=376 RepID=UPI001D2CE29C|nr:hypothetical protein [Bradyrhizobium sp.]MBI5320798.1 hypothetical protein [Bradyrhizobium sp.]
MSAGTRLQIDSSHCRAICDEIGERLRIVLDRETTSLPPRQQALMLRLVAQDLAGSPSIDDMARDEIAEDETAPSRAA